MDLKSLTSLKPKQWQLLVFFPLGTFVPGSLVVLHYRPDLFAGLDVAKLLLLSTALTTPTLLTNVFVALPQAVLQGPERADSDELCEPSDLYMMAGLASALTIYAALAAAYLWSLPFRSFVVALGLLSVALGAANWLRFLAKVKRG